ncbi:MAG: hypothetical protein WCY88_08145 [Spongiibacteraceae bacterium]
MLTLLHSPKISPSISNTALGLNIKSIVACLLFSLLLGTNAYGLEVGAISLNSALGQPLSAHLIIKNDQVLTEQELIVKLAPLSLHKEMGVDSSALYQNLKFDRLDLEGGDIQINISTHQFMKEPYLNFILQILWPEGEVFREFNLLFDPV